MGLLLAASAGAAEPSAAPAGTTQELVFFTADGPVRVRLALTLVGKPAEDAWRSALDGLFAHCDRNADGVLDSSERGRFANTGSGRRIFTIIDGMAVPQPQPPQVSFTETNGKVDRAAFREAFRQAGVGPVTVASVFPRADSQALTDALFKHLDADGDGNLSLAELKAARARLAALDLDEDELLTADELLGKTRNNGFYGSVVFSTQGRPRPQPKLGDVIMPAVGEPVTVKDLLAVRDTDKDGSLSAAELGCPAAAFAELDADGNGRLDAAELAAWLRRPPDLDVPLEVGAKAAARGTAVGATGRLAARSATDRAGGLKLDLRDVRFRFDREAETEASGLLAALRQAFEARAEKGGAVERKEVAAKPEGAALLPAFDFADRDRDGKVTPAELEAAVGVGEALSTSRVVVSVADRGRGLFELLDRDGDGRLSPRELNAAAAVLADLDRDGDGKLARDELPRGWVVTAKATAVELPTGGVAADSFDSVVILTDFAGGVSVVRPPPAGVPEWFRQMDRNGDGDVSAREFSGPPALFRKIDADGDGLISPAEAVAFERVSRKGR